MNTEAAFKLLLEEIAFRLSPQNVEKEAFIKSLYAALPDDKPPVEQPAKKTRR